MQMTFLVFEMILLLFTLFSISLNFVEYLTCFLLCERHLYVPSLVSLPPPRPTFLFC